jgi:CheY-like chemotaxis protein
VDLFRENRDIDLILMDLKMPVVDGYIATLKIREMDKKIPIIAQTAYALAGDSKKAMDAGCTDYITKPIKKEILLSKVERLLNN